MSGLAAGRAMLDAAGLAEQGTIRQDPGQRKRRPGRRPLEQARVSNSEFFSIRILYIKLTSFDSI